MITDQWSQIFNSNKIDKEECVATFFLFQPQQFNINTGMAKLHTYKHNLYL